MVHEKFIKRGGKIYGPYYYESYREDGKVKKRYIKIPPKSKNNFTLHIIFIVLFILIGAGFFFGVNSPNNFIFKYTGFSIDSSSSESASSEIVPDVPDLSESTPNEPASPDSSESIQLESIPSESPLSESNSPSESIEDDPQDVSDLLETEQEDNADEADLQVDKTQESKTDLEDELLEDETEQNVTTTETQEIVQEENSSIEINQTNSILEDSKINETSESDQVINQTLLEQNLTENLLELNLTENQTILSEINLTASNLTDETNLTENQTIEVDTIQISGAKVGEAVKFVKKVKLNKLEKITIKLPDEAEKIDISEVNPRSNLITGNVVVADYSESNLWQFVKKMFSRITGFVIENSDEAKKVEIDAKSDEYEIKFEMPAPESNESIITKNQKQIVISGPDSIHYTNVTAFTSLNQEIESESQIILFRITGGVNEKTNFEAYDTNDNRLIDYIEWQVPQLSNQTYRLILITKASHLNSSREIIEDVYDIVKDRDYNYTTIPQGDYLRIKFEKNLTGKNDITIYAKSNNSARVEVYEKNKDELIADFGMITEDQMYRVYLTNLVEEQDEFDLLVLNGDVEFDYVVDPVDNVPPQINFVSPTENNNIQKNQTYVIANISISFNSSDDYLASFIWNFNRVNYTIYNNSLLLLMNFDDSTGLNDTSVYENNGTANGAVWNASGKYGGSMQFDGTDDYVNIPDNALLDIYGANQVSIVSAWIRTGSVSAGTYPRAITKSDGVNQRAMELFYNGDVDRYYLQSYDGSNYLAVQSQTGLDDGNWHLIVAIRNNPMKMYVDGIDVSYGEDNSGWATDFNNNQPLRIGGDTGSSTDWAGQIDEVRIWNVSFTATEIYEMYISNLQKFNSTQWYFYINQSKNSTAGLDLGSYTYQAFATDSLGNANSTDLRTININDGIIPGISFISPTLNNGTITTNTSIPINISISESSLANLKYNWNGTNYTIYDDSLLLMMNFDNLSSLSENTTYFVDVSKYSINGTPAGGAFSNIVGGKYVGGVQLDGVGDYVSIPDNDAWDNDATMTLAVWAKFGSFRDWWEGALIGHDEGGGASSDKWIFSYDKIQNQTVFHINDGVIQSGPEMRGGVWAASINTWYHIVVVKSGSTYNFYLNGKLNGTDSNEYSIPNAATPLTIGFAETDASEAFNGTIDEVRIYNRSLSADEVYQLYANNLQKYNSTQWYLYVNQSKNATAGLENGTYTYQAFATDSLGNANSTDLRTVIVNTSYSSVTDTTYPIFSDYWDNNATMNGSGTAIFNVTILNTNGTAWLEINGTNTTATNLSANMYNVSYFLTNGTYSYKWWAYGNGTSKLINNSGTRYYTLNNTIIDTTYPLFTNFGFNITNGSQFSPIQSEANATITSTNGTAGIEFNGTNYTATNVGNLFSATLGQLSVGTYSYYWWAYGNGTSKLYNVSEINYYTLIQNSSYYVNFTAYPSSPITYPTQANFTCLNNAGLTSAITINGTAQNSGENVTLSVGSWNITCTTTANDNYTANVTQFDYVVNQGTGNINLLLNDSDSDLNLTYGSQINASAYSSGTITLYRDDVDVTAEMGVFVALGVGYYNYSAKSENVNYTAVWETHFLNVTKATTAINLYLNKSESDFSATTSYDLNVTCFASNTQGIINLTNNGTEINSGTSPINVTEILGIGLFNYTCEYYATQNYTSAIKSYVANISQLTDTTYPIFSDYWDNNATMNGSGTAIFNVTILNTNGTAWLEINGTNTTATNLSANMYNVSYFLTNGTYSYKWWAYGNGTSKLINNSGTKYYTLNNTILDATYPIFTNLGFNYTNGTAYANYVYSANATITSTNGTVGIEFNGTNYTATNVGNLFSATLGQLSVGTYAYYWWAYGNGTSKLYNSSVVGYYTINRGNVTLTLLIDGQQLNKTIQNGTISNVTCIVDTSQGNLNLTKNGTQVDYATSSVNETAILSEGYYNYTCLYEQTQNYSLNSKTFFLNVTSTDITSPIIRLIYPENSYSTTSTSIGFIFNVSDSSEIANCTLFANSNSYSNQSFVNKSANNTITATLSVGSYSWSVNCTDILNNLGNSSSRSLTISSTSFPAGGGTSSGGGTTIVKNVYSFSPSEIKVKIQQGKTEERQIVITNKYSKDIILSLSKTGLKNNLLTELDKVIVAKGKSEIIKLRFGVGEDEEPGVYMGKILLESEGQKEEILIIMEVESLSSLFDVEAKIPSQFKKISPGDQVVSEVKLSNFGETDKVDVVLDYGVKDEDGNVIASGKKTMAVKTTLSLTLSLKLPQNLAMEKYLFFVNANYEGKSAVSSDTFEVADLSILEIAKNITYNQTFRIIAGSIAIISLLSAVGWISMHFIRLKGLIKPIKFEGKKISLTTQDISRLIEQGKYYLKQNQKQAAENIYKQIKEMYNRLSEEEKTKINSDVMNFYKLL